MRGRQTERKSLIVIAARNTTSTNSRFGSTGVGPAIEGNSSTGSYSKRSPSNPSRPQDRAIDTALHDAALVADQLNHGSLGAGYHAAAAVHTHGGFVRDDREKVSDGCPRSSG